MTRLTTIEIDKDYLKFSAAHFTVFSEVARERLHGHNFKVKASFVAEVGDNGLCVDYSELKKKVLELCDALDEYTLIAKDSPYLHVEEQGQYYHIHFADEVMLLLKRDTLLLPIRNTTVEDLSFYLLQLIISDEAFQTLCPIQQIDIWVSSGPGQNGMSRWVQSQ
jgi:6-pyruvoyltetrahydropterin/6-carboxytetrahydropterin synthase